MDTLKSRVVKMSKKLTQSVVAGAGPRLVRYELWDPELRGFGLRIEPSGTKTFIVRYRANGGGRRAPRRYLTVGRYGVITAEEARKQARVALGSVSRGDDPATDRMRRRKEITVEDLVRMYEAEGARHLKTRTRLYTVNRLQHHVVPILGGKKVSEVSVGDVERFVRLVSEGQTACSVGSGRSRRIVRGGRGAAAKSVRDLSALFSFAARQEIIAFNPCSAAKKPVDGKRERYLSMSELQRLGMALSLLESEGAHPKALAATRLLAMTGCRRDEIAALKWTEVDFENRLLVLQKSKTGRSIRPLAAEALALLAGLPRYNSPFVFPADRGGRHFQGLRYFWAKLIQRAELPGVTPHTLRHTVGSVAASAGESLMMVGALLGHASYRSSSIYAHLQRGPVLDVAQRVSSRLAMAMNDGGRNQQ